MRIVKENLVGTMIRITFRHDGAPYCRAVVRGIGLQNSGFLLAAQITEAEENCGMNVGELTQFSVVDEYWTVTPETESTC
jgi:hypothetical protein